MKITKSELKEIIKEELEATLDEAGYFDPNRAPDEGYPFGKPLPGLRGAIKDLVPKSMAHAVGNKSKGLAGDPKYIAAWKDIGKELNSGNIETFIRKVKMSKAAPDAPLTPRAKDVLKKLLKSMDNNKLKTVHSLKDVVSLMGPEGQRKGHTIGSPHDPGYVRETLEEMLPLGIRMGQKRQQETKWVLRRSGKTADKEYLHPTPASDQKKGEYNWGPKDNARIFKGTNGKDKASAEKEALSAKGITATVEKK